LTERRIVVTGIVVTSLVLAVTTMAIRSYAIYKLATDQAVLQSKFDTVTIEERTRDDALRKELDAIERTLYTTSLPDPTTSNAVAPEGRRETAVESLLYARIKELRDRITVLEQWRMKVDRELR
jgi:hypothetical protein